MVFHCVAVKSICETLERKIVAPEVEIESLNKKCAEEVKAGCVLWMKYGSPTKFGR